MNKQLNRHMKNDKKEAKDIKKLIGNPKIIFVVGGPGLGKAAYCQKLVGEFGYTHISMGAVFQAEMAKVSYISTLTPTCTCLINMIILTIHFFLSFRATKKASASRKLLLTAESFRMK